MSSCREVIPILECPLSEVPLYMYQQPLSYCESFGCTYTQWVVVNVIRLVNYKTTVPEAGCT